MIFKKLFRFGSEKPISQESGTQDSGAENSAAQNEAVDSAPEKISQEKTSHEKKSQEKTSWSARLRFGLAHTAKKLSSDIIATIANKKLDANTLQDLEDILLQADLGIATTTNIINKLKNESFNKDISLSEIKNIIAGEIEKILQPVAKNLELNLDSTPHVILMVGVNGSGKTTTLGKIAAKLNNNGYKTCLVAADSFRAAAVEQLKIWGQKINSPVLTTKQNGDAAALIYDSYLHCKKNNFDIMLVDTAGRLQNKTMLMEELAKIIRVLKKHNPDAPQTILLTLDATTGNNALSQVDIFSKTAQVNGLIMTKLDGSAKGGILTAIADKYKLPIYFLGVGENVDDLQPFAAKDFANSLLEIDEPAK